MLRALSDSQPPLLLLAIYDNVLSPSPATMPRVAFWNSSRRPTAARRGGVSWPGARTGECHRSRPALTGRGPSQVVKAGKTPVLAPEEARVLIDSIEVTTVAGLRDRGAAQVSGSAAVTE
jgi:hypothetical protein